jgi:hypothetical integral membrane protein (TIGR02206 family)
MHYFFTYKEKIPEGIGFGLFSETHLLILFALATISWLFIRYYLKQGEDKQARLRKTLAILVFASEFIRQLSLVLTGQYEWGALPLDLCSFGWMVLVADAFASSKFTREVLYSLTLPGALAALITPNWTMFPAFNYYGMQSFFIHTLLVGYVVTRLSSREIIPNAKNLKYSLYFLAITLPLAFTANSLLGTNFFFLNVAAPGSPLEPLQKALGNGYILGMFGLLGIAWLILYTPWIFMKSQEGFFHIRQSNHKS